MRCRVNMSLRVLFEETVTTARDSERKWRPQAKWSGSDWSRRRWLPIWASPSLWRSAVSGDYRDLTEEQEPQAALSNLFRNVPSLSSLEVSPFRGLNLVSC